MYAIIISTPTRAKFSSLNDFISCHRTPIQATMIAKICPLCQKIFGKDFIKDHIGIEHFGKNDAVDCKDCKGQVTRESDRKFMKILLTQSSIFIVTNVTNDSYPNVQ